MMKSKAIWALVACLAFATPAFATSAEQSIPSVHPTWHIISYLEDEEDIDPVFDEEGRLKQLMELYDPNMSVRAFNEAIASVFPNNDEDGALVNLFQHHYYDEQATQFVYGPLTHAAYELRNDQSYFDFYRHPNDPPGYSLSMMRDESDSTSEFVIVDAGCWLGFTTLDPDGISVGERERLLSAYVERLTRFFDAHETSELLRQDPIALFNAERDRLTAELSTPAFHIRAINFYCSVNTDVARYETPFTFIDNVDTPPYQTPLDGIDAVLKHTDLQMGISYGEMDGEGVISPDGGVTWYANGWRDVKTGISHRYEPKIDVRSVSPNGGENWYIEIEANMFALEEEPVKLVFWDGNWSMLDHSTTGQLPTTLTEALASTD